MTYFNPVLRYGVDAFARDLAAAGGLGVITPDLIPDEADEWLAASDGARAGPDLPGRAVVDRGADRLDGRREQRVPLRDLDDGRHRRARHRRHRRRHDRRPLPTAHGPADRRRPRRPLGRAGRRGRGVRRRGDRRLGVRGRGGARGPAGCASWPPSWPPGCAGRGTAAGCGRRAPIAAASHTDRACTLAGSHTLPGRCDGRTGCVTAASPSRRGMIGVWPPPPRALPACAPPRTRVSWTRCAAGTGSGC